MSKDTPTTAKDSRTLEMDVIEKLYIESAGMTLPEFRRVVFKLVDNARKDGELVGYAEGVFNAPLPRTSLIDYGYREENDQHRYES